MNFHNYLHVRYEEQIIQCWAKFLYSLLNSSTYEGHLESKERFTIKKY